MIIHNFDPVIVDFGFLQLRWYSLSYILGILAGWYLAKNIFINDDKLNEKFNDFITYLIIGIILGGRLGYVIFYNFNYYSNNIIDIFIIET